MAYIKVCRALLCRYHCTLAWTKTNLQLFSQQARLCVEARLAVTLFWCWPQWHWNAEEVRFLSNRNQLKPFFHLMPGYSVHDWKLLFWPTYCTLRNMNNNTNSMTNLEPKISLFSFVLDSKRGKERVPGFQVAIWTGFKSLNVW